MVSVRRFGAIGDIHAEDAFLEAALDYMARFERVDQILAVGDIVDGRGDVDRCVELLERHRVTAVAGNHDRWLRTGENRDLPLTTYSVDLAPRTLAFVRAQPRTRRFDTVAGGMMLCHGFGEDDMVFVNEVLADAPNERERRRERGRLLRLIPRDVSMVVCGHSHRRGVRRLGRLTVINAGTLKSGDTPCFLVADLEAKEVQFYDLDEDAQVLESERVRIV